MQGHLKTRLHMVAVLVPENQWVLDRWPALRAYVVLEGQEVCPINVLSGLSVFRHECTMRYNSFINYFFNAVVTSRL